MRVTAIFIAAAVELCTGTTASSDRTSCVSGMCVYEDSVCIDFVFECYCAKREGCEGGEAEVSLRFSKGSISWQAMC